MYPSLSENQAWAKSASENPQQQNTSSDEMPSLHNGTGAGNGSYSYSHHHHHSSGSSRSRRPMSNQFPRGYLNCVYWPNGAVLQGHKPSELPIQHITHLFYSHATVNFDGTVMLSNEKADLQFDVDGCKGGLLACTSLKLQNPRIKVILSVGGAASALAFPFIVSDQHKMVKATFLRDIRELVARYQLDGIEINWEHPKDPEEGSALVSILSTLRAALPSRTHILTASLPGIPSMLEQIDLEQLQHWVEYVTLKTYDLTGETPAKSAHNSQLLSPTLPNSPVGVASCQSAVEYLQSQNFALDKVLLGISCTGLAFVGAKGPGQSFKETQRIPYRDLPLEGSEEYVDNSVGAWCADNRCWVSYDCPETVLNKARFVKMRHLRGLFFWDGSADRRDSHSLTFSGYEALRSNT